MTKLSNTGIQKAIIEFNNWRKTVDKILEPRFYTIEGGLITKRKLDDVRIASEIKIRQLEDVIKTTLETRISRLERIIEGLTGKKIFLVDEEEK